MAELLSIFYLHAGYVAPRGAAVRPSIEETLACKHVATISILLLRTADNVVEEARCSETTRWYM